MISVSMVDANVYEVVVEAKPRTTHRVTLAPDYYRELCGMTVTHEWLIVQAFNFLLEREPNTAILAQFDLRQIGSYFPEFESVLKQQIGYEG